MKDLPLKPLQLPVARNLLPHSSKPALSGELEKLADVAKNADASIISLPRTKSKDSQVNDASSVLESFLGAVKEEKDLVSAHSGLDASRVFDLLNDED